MPYQLVPSDAKDNRSIFPVVAVIVGAPAAGHLTPVNVAVVGVPDDGCLSSNTNEAPATAVGIVKVHAVADVRVAVMTVPVEMSRVADAPTVPLVTTPSTFDQVLSPRWKFPLPGVPVADSFVNVTDPSVGVRVFDRRESLPSHAVPEVVPIAKLLVPAPITARAPAWVSPAAT